MATVKGPHKLSRFNLNLTARITETNKAVNIISIAKIRTQTSKSFSQAISKTDIFGGHNTATNFYGEKKSSVPNPDPISEINAPKNPPQI